VYDGFYEGFLLFTVTGYRNFILFQDNYDWRMISQIKFPIKKPLIFSYDS